MEILLGFVLWTKLFYNIKTQESTWEPPLGMEHQAYRDESHNLNELAIEAIEMDVCLFILRVDYLLHEGALFKAAMNIASTFIMFLPRNVDINQLAELALSTSPDSPPWSLEVEKNYLNGKLKAITAYYSRQHGCVRT